MIRYSRFTFGRMRARHPNSPDGFSLFDQPSRRSSAGRRPGHARARLFSGWQSFTLIELLVVVAIVAVLAGLLLPALNRAQARAHAVSCLNNLKQLQIAWQMYIDDHGGKLPENYADLSTGVWRSSSNSWAGPSSAPASLGPKTGPAPGKLAKTLALG